MNNLRRINDICGWEIDAKDGKIGTCHDFLFDETDWVVRYIVANTGTWLLDRKVLVSPIMATSFDETDNILGVGLTRDQLEGAPSLESDAPVSRRYEIAYNQYFSWSSYWSGTSIWGPHLTPDLLNQKGEGAQREGWVPGEKNEKIPERQTHLRSAREVAGYHIHASDGDIGHVEDFLMDEKSWAIRYLVINTRNWFPGGKWVLITPSWTEDINWERREVAVTVSADKIKDAPEYDPDLPVDRAYEKILYDYYGKPYSW